MSGNSAFVMVSERGWRRGLGNMLRSELAHWWGTRMWWIQSLIWVGVIAFMLGAMLLGPADKPPVEEVLMIYAIFAGLFPAVGVVIIMQGAVVGEKKDGTAAWVLSKPVSRPAFILSKVISNSLGVLVTMVVLPGIAAYAMFAITIGSLLNPSAFLAALGVLFINNFFYLSLTLMLGTLFNGRGPVIGISLAFLFLQQYLVRSLPFLRYVLPWNLILPIGDQVDAVVPGLLLGQHTYSPIPVVVVALEGILFILVGLQRFNREEF
jgi:ABC-2 type transport system permease protein